jgi:hypothetical protein
MTVVKSNFARKENDAFLSYYEAINMLRIRLKLVKLIKARAMNEL